MEVPIFGLIVQGLVSIHSVLLSDGGLGWVGAGGLSEVKMLGRNILSGSCGSVPSNS